MPTLEELKNKYGVKLGFVQQITPQNINTLSTNYGSTLNTTAKPTMNYGEIVSKYGARLETPVQKNEETPGMFEGTKKAFQDIIADPLSLKANPTKILADAFNSIKDPLIQESQRIQELFQSKSVSETAGHVLENIAGVAGVVLSPISALFNSANDIPVLGSVSKLVSLPFIAAGEGASGISGAIVDQLPIPQGAKDNIKTGVQEISALAAQLALGKAIDIGIKQILPADRAYIKIKEDLIKENPEYAETVNKIPIEEVKRLSKIHSPEDVKTILKQAVEVSRAKEVFDAEQPAKTSVETPEVVKKGQKPTSTKVSEQQPVTIPKYEEWIKTNPEANKFIADVTEKAKTIPSAKAKVAFLKQEKSNFDTKFSNEYASAVKSLDTTPTKTVEIPKEPTITPETTIQGKTPKRVLDINRSLVKKGFETLEQEQMSKYGGKVVAQERAKLENILNTDLPKLYEMANGRAPLEGFDPGMLWDLAVKKATLEGDVNMQMRLAKSPLAAKLSEAASTMRLGQEYMAGEGNPVKAMVEINKAREKLLNEKIKPAELAKEIKKIKEKVDPMEKLIKKMTC